MDRVDLLCLCQQYDLRALYGTGFAAYPDIRLVTPDDLEDPSAIRYAFAFRPLPDAFDALPHVELVISAGAGVDGLLQHPGLRPEISVARMVNPSQAEMMAGFASYHVIGHHRRMWDFAEFQKSRTWAAGHGLVSPEDFSVAILGYGAMGRATGRALASMGYRVTGWASIAREVDGIRVLAGEKGLEQALADAQAVICLLPLTDATRGILNARTFAMMRDNAILVQLGRGDHLVESDLLDALDLGRPVLAALDVFATEPLAGDSPLWDHPQVMITPHIASESDADAVAGAAALAIQAHAAGKPVPGLVDRARGY